MFWESLNEILSFLQGKLFKIKINFIIFLFIQKSQFFIQKVHKKLIGMTTMRVKQLSLSDHEQMNKKSTALCDSIIP